MISSLSNSVSSNAKNPLFGYIKEENVQKIDTIIRERIRNQNDHLALHKAAKKGNVDIFRKLQRSQRFGTLITENKHGYRPLHVAIMKGQTEILEEICDNPAHLNCFLMYEGHHFDPLSFAVWLGQKECARILLSKLYGPTSDMRLSPKFLHRAILKNQFEILEEVLTEYHKFSFPLLEQRNNEGQTPLNFAAAQEKENFVQLLLEIGVNVNTQDDRAWTPLHYAMQHKNQDLVVMLMDEGADPALHNREGKTPERLVGNDPIIQVLRGKQEEIRNHEERSINYHKFPPRFAVFQGGGPSAFGYMGAVKALEKEGLLSSIKRFAGTSAGAITATLLAIGFSAEESKDVLKEVPISFFLDHAFNAENFFSGFEWKQLLGLFKLFYSIKKLDPSYLIAKLVSFEGLCKGEHLQQWIESEIVAKTGIPNCTFKELRELILKRKKNPAGKLFNHLHIVATKISSSPEVQEFSTEDSKCDDYVISYVIAASGAVPLIFKPRTLYKKNREGQLVEQGHERYLDGGLILNFPLEVFDKKKYLYHGLPDNQKNQSHKNKRVLGFRLYSPQPLIQDAPVSGIFGLLKAVFNVYYNAEEQLREQMDSSFRDRIVEIDNLGVRLYESHVPPEVMDAMSEIAYEATMRRLNPESHSENASNELIQRTPLSNLARRPPTAHSYWYTAELHLRSKLRTISRIPMHIYTFKKKFKMRHFQRIARSESLYKIFHYIIANNHVATRLISQPDTRTFLENSLRDPKFLDELFLNNRKEFLRFLHHHHLLNLQQQNDAGPTLFHLAIKKNTPKLFGVLLDQITPEDRLEQMVDEQGNTILHTIIKIGKKDFYNVIEKSSHTAVLFNALNNENKTPVFVALEEKRYFFAKRLFENNETDLTLMHPTLRCSLFHLLHNHTTQAKFCLTKKKIEKLMCLLLDQWKQRNELNQMISLVDPMLSQIKSRAVLQSLSEIPRRQISPRQVNAMTSRSNFYRNHRRYTLPANIANVRRQRAQELFGQLNPA